MILLSIYILRNKGNCK